LKEWGGGGAATSHRGKKREKEKENRKEKLYNERGRSAVRGHLPINSSSYTKRRRHEERQEIGKAQERNGGEGKGAGEKKTSEKRPWSLALSKRVSEEKGDSYSKRKHSCRKRSNTTPRCEHSRKGRNLFRSRDPFRKEDIRVVKKGKKLFG